MGILLRLGFVFLPLLTIFSCTAAPQKKNDIAASSPTSLKDRFSSKSNLRQLILAIDKEL